MPNARYTLDLKDLAMSNPMPDEPAQPEPQGQPEQQAQPEQPQPEQAQPEHQGQPEHAQDEQARRRRWLLLLLLLLLLLICGLIAFVSCRSTNDEPGSTGATPNTSPSHFTSVTFTESPSAEPSPSAPPSMAATLTMPDVVGKEADTADMTLRATGFVDVTFVDTDGQPAALLQSWEVTKQSVPAGTAVPASEPIVLTVKEKTNGRG
jgi:PASTA domain